MRIDIITLFPGMFAALDEGLPGRARRSGALDLRTHALRDFPVNRYGAVDDYPYGGEPGMVLRPEPLESALERALEGRDGVPVLVPSPDGPRLDQSTVRAWAEVPELVVVCGHYKGLDERFRTLFASHAFSLGDFIVSGGEFAAIVFVDAVARLLPGVLGDEASARTDSFEDGLLGWPVYTRPELWRGLRVPQVLLGGDHARIARWRRQQQLLRTRDLRPDLWERHRQTEEDGGLLRLDAPFDLED